MLAHTLRQSARFAPTVRSKSSSAGRCTASSNSSSLTRCPPCKQQLRQTVRHGSMGGSAQRPIQDAGHDVKVKSKEHSNAIVFGGLAAVGAIAVAWMMADTSGALRLHAPL